MPYLIDGHNLIGQMRGLRLDDPDDEAKLVQALKGFMMRHRKRCTVYFDAGLPGGPDRQLSSRDVKVVFAPGGTAADALIVREISKKPDPNNWTVISGDQAIVSEAQRRGMKVIDSRTFARDLEAAHVPDDADPNPHVSPDEIERWLRMFGEGENDDA